MVVVRFVYIWSQVVCACIAGLLNVYVSVRSVFNLDKLMHAGIYICLFYIIIKLKVGILFMCICLYNLYLF